MADKYISEFPTHTPVGTDYLAIEDSSETGKATVNNIVSAAAVVATLLGRQGTLASGDLNSLYTHGVYSMVQANTYTNQPTGVTIGMLLVLQPQTTSNIYTTQLIVSYSGNVYVRIRQSDAWSAWKTL